MKYENPKMKESETPNQSSYSTSTFQRYSNDIIMLSPDKIQPNNTNKRTRKPSNTKFDNNSHREHDLKRAQMTPNDLQRPQTTSNETVRNKKRTNWKVVQMLKLAMII